MTYPVLRDFFRFPFLNTVLTLTTFLIRAVQIALLGIVAKSLETVIVSMSRLYNRERKSQLHRYLAGVLSPVALL